MSSQAPRSFFSKVWTGFWHTVESARRITLNLLFLLFVILLIRLLTLGGPESNVRDGSTLILQPIGNVVEQYSGYPVDRAIGRLTGDEVHETQLRDLLEALDHAYSDQRIKQVLIDTSRLIGLGAAQMQELAQALEHFRSSGKRVIAMDSYYSQDRYFLASLADEIWLDPRGMLWFEGLAYYRNFFKDALDKLEVSVNLFRVGTYKSALEPFIRNDMSEADRTAGQFLIDDLWNNYLSAIALHRGLPAEVLNEVTQNYAEKMVQAKGDAAQLALDLGLVDRLMTWPEARAELAQGGAADAENGFRQVAMLDYLAEQRLFQAQAKDQVGVIVAEGAISGGDLPPGTVGSESLVRLLRRASQDEHIKAVVLRVNSPGGDALASEVIRREMSLLNDSGKPVIVSMGNIAASGGYWIAMGAEEVWASPGTITGSIGIFGVIPTFEKSLNKLGIHTDGVGTTPLSGAVRADRELSAPAGSMIQALIERGYRDFITLVSEYRGLSPEEVDMIAQGRVWTGSQALERQLVDQSGGLQDAIQAAARRAGLGDNYQVSYVEEELSSFERWLVEAGSSAMVSLGFESKSLLPQLALQALQPTELKPDALIALGQLSKQPQVRQAAEQLQVLLGQPGQPQILAHCFCLAP